MVWVNVWNLVTVFFPSLPSMALDCTPRSLGLPSLANKNKSKKFSALLSALYNNVLVNV